MLNPHNQQLVKEALNSMAFVSGRVDLIAAIAGKVENQQKAPRGPRR